MRWLKASPTVSDSSERDVPTSGTSAPRRRAKVPGAKLADVLFRSLVLLSLGALALALWKADYLRVPRIVSPVDLLTSFAFLFAGLLAGTLTWQRALKAANCSLSILECLASTGLTVFAKYLPGKIWSVAGRAAYVARRTGHPISQLSYLCLKLTLLAIWCGLTLGTVGLVALQGVQVWGRVTAISWVLATAVIFSRPPQRVAMALGRWLLKWDTAVLSVDFNAALLVPWSLLGAILRSVGFLFLVRALVPGEIPWGVGFGLPLASALGMIVVVAPAGLGVREGILTAYLVLAGISTAEATTVAVAARLWFFIGEVFLFLIGVVAHTSRPHAAACDHADPSAFRQPDSDRLERIEAGQVSSAE